jgi:hypothetical protein
VTAVEIPAREVEVGDELVLARIHHEWPSRALQVEQVSTETVTAVSTVDGHTTITTAVRQSSCSANTLKVVDRP